MLWLMPFLVPLWTRCALLLCELPQCSLFLCLLNKVYGFKDPWCDNVMPHVCASAGCAFSFCLQKSQWILIWFSKTFIQMVPFLLWPFEPAYNTIYMCIAACLSSSAYINFDLEPIAFNKVILFSSTVYFSGLANACNFPGVGNLMSTEICKKKKSLTRTIFSKLGH